MKPLFENWRKYLNEDRKYRSDAEAKINPSDMHLEKDSPDEEIKDKILTTFKKEGGAAGFQPLFDAAKEIDKDITEEEVKEILSALSDIEQHDDSDYVDVSGLKEAVEIFLEAKEEMLDEKRKRSKSRTKKKRKAKKKKKGKKDACYHKVKSRYDVWPSAYASGALVKCRKVGASNWGKSKKNESLDLEEIIRQELQSVLDECWSTHERVPGTKKGAPGSCRKKGSTKESLSEQELEEKKKKKKKKKTNFSKEKKSGLHGWFSRRGGKGKSKGWIDCNTCKKGKGGRKTCKTCGRKDGEKRAKYPHCRPTPSDCGTSKRSGKKSKAGKKG